MPKPWARYEVNFINHDKFRALPATAICLWLEGKNYADDKHTDGLLPDYEVKHWRFYGKHSMALLIRSCGIKPGTDQPYAPLWDVVDGFGFKMHDYLEHNECRDEVLAKIAQKEESREADRVRLERWRKAKKTKRETANETPDETVDETAKSAHETVLKRSDQNTEFRIQKELSVSGAGAPDVGERAGRLLERYRQDWYPTHRNGARLRLVGSPLEFQDACSLCDTWDDPRLEKLAAIVLTTDDPFISGTDRSFKIFALKASWADDRLTAWEQEHGVVA